MPMLRLRHSQIKTERMHQRPEGRKTPHKYPIAMWRMVAEVMATFPGNTVRHGAKRT
jgi:hypothetical protein